MLAISTFPKFICACLAALVLHGCDQGPREGTSAYYAKYLADHGVVKGKDAHLKLGGHMFTFPASVLEELTIDGSIAQDQPRVIRFWLRGNAARPAGAASIPELPVLGSWLRIEIRRSPGTRDGRDEGFDHERPWGSIREVPEWQLKEYRDKKSTGGWGDFSYESLDGAPKTPMNQPVRFSCTDTYPHHGECWGGYRFNSEIQVWYFFPAVWLPIWQQVNQHVVSTVEHYHQPSKP